MQLGATCFSNQPCFGRLLRNPSAFSRFSPLVSSSTSTRPRSTSTHISSSIQTHLANLEKLLLHSSDVVSDQPEVVAPKKAIPGGFNGLNLAGIWPGNKRVEEMSPRHFNKLKRLLSRRADYSPRNPIAARWLDYHGRGDWSGLLDPLDENLRREIVRYGEFVQGAYHTFHSDPATLASAPPLERLVSIPDGAFRVTKNLYATSSMRLPGWVEEVAPAWMTQRSSWVGYVAVCESPAEIARMGRRDIIISLRGTATCLEWAENARANLVAVDGDLRQEDDTTNDSNTVTDTDIPGPMVECGFSSLYNTRGAHVASLSESIRDEIRRLIDHYKGEQLSITVTGHSLGAALAVLAADELSSINDAPPIAVISFGGPRVGNRAFAKRITERGVKVLRVVNARDMVTRVPGLPVDDGSSDDKEVWGYSHVGSELRLDSKASPFLKPDADLACCHDLEAYLHLVDGFMGSGCPFRDNAKRPLWKLLNEQRSNMKKLYTSTAKDLATMQAVSCLTSPS